jgi:hypothetical protein
MEEFRTRPECEFAAWLTSSVTLGKVLMLSLNFRCIVYKVGIITVPHHVVGGIAWIRGLPLTNPP